jgi:hypothetical protein
MLYVVDVEIILFTIPSFFYCLTICMVDMSDIILLLQEICYLIQNTFSVT